LFDFVCKGINALEYKEHLHYDVVKSANPELKKATIQINVYKQHSYNRGKYLIAANPTISV